MIETAAVLAHYDPENRLDESFRTILISLRRFCDLVLLVTTSDLPDSELPEDPAIVTLRRPNFGYDFYSFRVGVNALAERGPCKRLFLVNSSFLLTDSRVFEACLEEMIGRSNVAQIVGVTESFQGDWHLQSYLMLVRQDVLSSQWFIHWLESVEPKNTKMETILIAEMGLSRSIKKNGAGASVIFSESIGDDYRARMKWARWLIANEGFSSLRQISRPNVWKGYNPTHFSAKQLAQRCGLVKTELVRSNPLGLDIGWLADVAGSQEMHLIRAFIERTNSFYSALGDGLTGLAKERSALPAHRLVFSAPIARPGVRIGVVVHIYYMEFIDEICACLSNIAEPFDLFVTTPHEGAVADLFDRLSVYGSAIVVSVSENRGRDIGPFLTLLRSGLFDRYNALLKLHTKHSGYSTEGRAWRRALFASLCGDASTVRRSLELLGRNRVGLVGPHDYYLSHVGFWGGNRERLETILNSVRGGAYEKSSKPGFFAGSMFWFKPQALARLREIPESLLDFEPELGQQDATVAHVLERAISEFARRSGFISTSLQLDGEDIDKTATVTNRIPVLAAP